MGGGDGSAVALFAVLSSLQSFLMWGIFYQLCVVRCEGIGNAHSYLRLSVLWRYSSIASTERKCGQCALTASTILVAVK